MWTHLFAEMFTLLIFTHNKHRNLLRRVLLLLFTDNIGRNLHNRADINTRVYNEIDDDDDEYFIRSDDINEIFCRYLLLSSSDRRYSRKFPDFF